MSQLTPNHFQRRFQDLMEIGRARLRSLAPEWTDHNAHDPGITLMELLAWNTEAQLYSLARLRRDERSAYAALLGLDSAGTQPANGLIWPDLQDLNSASSKFEKNVLIAADTVVSVVGLDNPTFRPVDSFWWTPGRVIRLVTRHSDGRITDHTRTNAHGGHSFLPFGERAGRRDVLALTFECRDPAGLLGEKSGDRITRHWTIGILADETERREATSNQHLPAALRPSLSASLVVEDRRFPLNVISDSSFGLLTSGAIVFDLSQVPLSPREFTLELRSDTGFARPPRVLRVAPNVVAIQQGRSISQELHIANGLPDWSFELNEPGLVMAAAGEPVVIEVAEPSGCRQWRRCERLSDLGPREQAYELDPATGEVTFGNGINGRVPSAESQVMASYGVSQGAAGGIARNRKWKVTGFPGEFGINPESIRGGADAPDTVTQRRTARRRLSQNHSLVTAEDLEHAARSLPLLEVARAWVAPVHSLTPRTGEITLVALRNRPDRVEPEQTPETSRWLDAIRRCLMARMALGSRLNVVAPRYTQFSIHAQLESQPGVDPQSVHREVMSALSRRLALVASDTDTQPRQPGINVTRRDLTTWMRAIRGVHRVIALKLLNADGARIDEVKVSSSGLPRWDRAHSTIDIVRKTMGGRS